MRKYFSKKHFSKINFILLFLIVSALKLTAQNSTLYSGNMQKIEQWKDDRFGMFIHWGPITLKGTEIGWSRYADVPVEEYDNLYKQFNPVNFNADEWVSVAKAAGMKYIVLTTKHHDGFCLWPTRQIDHNISNTPFKRDVVKELADACKKQGIDFGTYYSTTDWYHPDFPLTGSGGKIRKEKSNLDAYTTYLKKQVAELLLNYGPLYVLWFDVPQEFDAVRGQGVIDFARTIQPDIIINDRTGAKGDFDCPEQRIGGFNNTRPWETCMTIAQQWAWKPNDQVKSLEQCLQTLIRSAGGDGNLLFNVGPDATGKIEPEQVARLKEMGAWLDKYGNTIYGTRGGPFKPTDWGVSTRKGNKIFLHILVWNGNTLKIDLPNIGMKVKSCKILDGKSIKYSQKENNISLEFPVKLLNPINTIVEMEVDGNSMDIKALDIVPQSLSYQKTATASTNPNPWWTGIKNINNGDWSGHGWIADSKDKEPWAEIDFAKPTKVKKAIIYENGNNVKRFELQCYIGDKWETIYKGDKIKNGVEIVLRGITTHKIRLVLKEFNSIPEIQELVLM